MKYWPHNRKNKLKLAEMKAGQAHALQILIKHNLCEL